MNWDPRLTDLGVYWKENPNAHWTLDSAVYQDENEAQGNHIILFTVNGRRGQPRAGVTCVVDWVGRDPGDVPTRVTTDANGQANVPIYANLDLHKKNGPYFAFIDSADASDVVGGMGLPEHHHVNFLLTWMPRTAAQPPAPGQSLEDAVRARAQSVPWMPVNNQAALWKFAQAHGLQDQQTDELPLTYNGEDYIVQVFNLGIVYVQVGDWGNVHVLQK